MEYKEENKHELENIKEGMDKQTTESLGVLTEDSFVLGYLHMFVALSKNSNDESIRSSEPFKKWMEYSKAGRKEVIVVDTKDIKKELYRVPAIYASAEVDTNFLSEQIPSMSEVPLVWEQEFNYTPARGEIYLNDIISKIDYAVKEQKEDVRKRWLDIFLRYKDGYTPYEKPKEDTINKVLKTKPTGNLQSDDTDDLW